MGTQPPTSGHSIATKFEVSAEVSALTWRMKLNKIKALGSKQAATAPADTSFSPLWGVQVSAPEPR
jgi:hypothetical protein